MAGCEGLKKIILVVSELFSTGTVLNEAAIEEMSLHILSGSFMKSEFVQVNAQLRH